MSVRTQMVIISYTLSLVLLAFVQFAHTAWDTTATDTTGAAPTRVMIAAGLRP
jgi:hypothetical protein